MKGETDLSYLSAFYYTAAGLLLLTSVFAAFSRSWGIAAVCFILGSVLFSYRVQASKTRKQSSKPIRYNELHGDQRR